MPTGGLSVPCQGRLLNKSGLGLADMGNNIIDHASEALTQRALKRRQT